LVTDASLRSDLLFNQYSNNKGFDKIYCLNEERRFVSNLRARFSQSASADGSHMPCQHPHLQFLSKLVTRMCPKIYGTPSVTTSGFFFPSLNAKTSLTPLEKPLFSFCSFQNIFQTKNFTFPYNYCDHIYRERGEPNTLLSN